MKKQLLAAALLASSCVLPNAAFAAMADLVSSADGSYSSDTISGLDWLDSSSTYGKSYDLVTSQFALGEIYAGWRYATISEFSTLVSNVAGPVINASGEFDFDATQWILSNIGTTPDGQARLLTSDVTTWNGRQYVSRLYTGDSSSTFGSAVGILNPKNYNKSASFSNAYFGSALVRDGLIATPIPAALFMFAPALLGFLGFRRRRSA